MKRGISHHLAGPPVEYPNLELHISYSYISYLIFRAALEWQTANWYFKRIEDISIKHVINLNIYTSKYNF